MINLWRKILPKYPQKNSLKAKKLASGLASLSQTNNLSLDHTENHKDTILSNLSKFHLESNLSTKLMKFQHQVTKSVTNPALKREFCIRRTDPIIQKYEKRLVETVQKTLTSKKLKPKNALFRSIEQFIDEIKRTNADLKQDTERLHRINYVYGLFLAQKILPMIEKLNKDRSDKKMFSYISEIAIQLSRYNISHWKFFKVYFIWLRKDANLAFWTTKDKRFMNKMLRAPFTIFNEVFEDKKSLEIEFYDNNVTVIENHLERIYEKRNRVFRTNPNFIENISLLETIGNCIVELRPEYLEMVMEEFEYILENLVESQLDLFSMMTSYCVINLKHRNEELCQSLDTSFVKSLAQFGELDEEIFTEFFMKRFIRHSENFKNYFPNSFKTIVKYTKNHNSISFGISKDIVGTSYFPNVPQELNSQIIESMVYHFEVIYQQQKQELQVKDSSEEKNMKPLGARERQKQIQVQLNLAQQLIRFLFQTSKSKNLDFNMRDKLNLKLKKFLRLTDLPMPYSYYTMFLQTEIELRYFDEDKIDYIADYFCKMSTDHQNHRRSKENCINKIKILNFLSQTTLPVTHPVFQKILYLIEDDYNKEESIDFSKYRKSGKLTEGENQEAFDEEGYHSSQDVYMSQLYGFSTYINGLFNLYSKALLDNFTEIPDQGGILNQEEIGILNEQIRANAETIPQYCDIYLRSFLPKILQIASMDSENISSIEMKVKHQMIRILISLSQNGFFQDNRADSWNKIVNHLAEQFQTHEFTQQGDFKKVLKNYESRFDMEESIFSYLSKIENLKIKKESRLLVHDIDFKLTLSSAEGLEDKVVYLEYDGWHHFSRKKQNYRLRDKINRLQMLNSGQSIKVLNMKNPDPIEQQLDNLINEMQEKV